MVEGLATMQEALDLDHSTTNLNENYKALLPVNTVFKRPSATCMVLSQATDKSWNRKNKYNHNSEPY